MERSEAPIHRPVMAREVVRILVAGEVDLLLDATVGAGGHSASFLAERGDSARVIGLDRDPEMLTRARERLAEYGDRVRLVARSFAEVGGVLDELGEATIDGALFDLGANSLHFDAPDRGFSLQSPGPLDMRFDRRGGETAADIVNGASEEELARIFSELGDEPNARRIASAIVAERPIRDTLRLAEIVDRATPVRGRTHPATRVFQSLRMQTNAELAHVANGLPAAFGRLRAGGRLVALTFHSGEDRLVKGLLRDEVRAGRAVLLTKKPIRPDAEEVRSNRRARSVKLRAAERRGEAGA